MTAKDDPNSQEPAKTPSQPEPQPPPREIETKSLKHVGAERRGWSAKESDGND